MKQVNKPSIKRQRSTVELDASGKVLGRLSTRIAMVLRGKHLPTFRPHEDCGDVVRVKNIAELVMTGKKMSQKVYYHYSGYLGGLKEKKLSEVWAKDPKWVLKQAVLRMLPKNRLRKDMIKRLIIE